MKHFQVFLILSAALGAAWAQPATPASVGAPAEPEQRRAQLRSVLKIKAPHVQEAQDQEAREKALALESDQRELWARHLSAQERYDLRQQLRRQQLEARQTQP